MNTFERFNGLDQNNQEAHTTNEEVLARVVSTNYTKDNDPFSPLHLSISQKPVANIPPATTAAQRKEIQITYSHTARDNFYEFLKNPNAVELQVTTRSMNASPLIHDDEHVLGIIKTNDNNEEVAIDVIGGCGPDETIGAILDREGLSEEAAMIDMRTHQLVLAQNGYDMSPTINYLRANAKHHLENKGFVPEPFLSILDELVRTSRTDIIKPIPYGASPTIQSWLDRTMPRATVHLTNIYGESAKPTDCHIKVHDEGSDAVLALQVPDLKKYVTIGDLEWVVNDNGIYFPTQRNYVILPIPDWERLGQGKKVENAHVLRNGKQEIATINLPLKSLASSMFSPISKRAY